MTDNPGVTRLKLEGHRLLDRITMRTVTRFQALTPPWPSRGNGSSGCAPIGSRSSREGSTWLSSTPAAIPAEARQSILSELGLADDAFVVLAVGRVEPQKGHRYLIEAMPAILGAGSRRRAPGGGSARSIQPDGGVLIEQLGLGPGHFLLGRRSDVPRLLGGADVFVFPSLFEGLGVSLLQAMGRALPW